MMPPPEMPTARPRHLASPTTSPRGHHGWRVGDSINDWATARAGPAEKPAGDRGGPRGGRGDHTGDRRSVRRPLPFLLPSPEPKGLEVGASKKPLQDDVRAEDEEPDEERAWRRKRQICTGVKFIACRSQKASAWWHLHVLMLPSRLERCSKAIRKQQEKESWEMNAHEKLEAAEKKKVSGNGLFKIGKFQRPAKKCNKALNYVNEDGRFEDEPEKLIKTLRVSCWLNHAACCLKLKHFPQTISLCSKVLEIESCNVKALYRRAQAYGEAYDLELAKKDVLKALKLDPNNKWAQTVALYGVQFSILHAKGGEVISSKSEKAVGGA